MARLTMISGFQRTRMTTSRGHSIVVVSGRLGTSADARFERPGEAPAAGRLSMGRRQTFRQE